MKKLFENVMRAMRQARKRRLNQHSLAELDAHTLRDIGLDRASEQARLEIARYRVHFGLY
jgi:uncharacterized protein YjiS (DUF1127 family)